MAAEKTVLKNVAPAEKAMGVVLFHGDKGGVGKSIAASAFIDYMIKKNIPVAAVDGDMRNADVSRMFSGSIPTKLIEFRTQNGWMDLMDYAIEQKDKHLVVSMPAGIGADIELAASRFVRNMENAERRIYLAWVMSRTLDSVNLLGEALDSLGGNLHGRVVIKNLFYGSAESFTRWDSSKLRKSFEACDGITLEFPELASVIVDKMNEGKDTLMAFSNAATRVKNFREYSPETSPYGFKHSENQLFCEWLDEVGIICEQMVKKFGL